MAPKQVIFTDISVREYAFELGDNPACSSGAPLTIGWEVEQSYTRPVELYEYMREARRRHGKQLIMPVPDRARILLNAGYGLQEIANATMSVEEAKKERAESLKASDNLFGRLPKAFLNGVAKQLMKPIRHTVQARSA